MTKIAIPHIIATSIVICFCASPICYPAQSASRVVTSDSDSGDSPTKTRRAKSIDVIESNAHFLKSSKIDQAVADFTKPTTSKADEVTRAPKLQGALRKVEASGQSKNFDFDSNSDRAQFGASATPTPDLYSSSRRWLKETHPEFNLQQSVPRADQVVVVSGSGHDRVDSILNRYGIPCKTISWRPRSTVPNLDGVKVLILTCDDNGDVEGDEEGGFRETSLSPAVSQAIKQWVSDGGFLITTGWETRFLSQYMPGYFKVGKKVSITSFNVLSGSPLLNAKDKGQGISLKAEPVVDEEIADKKDLLLAGLDNPPASKTWLTMSCGGTWTVAVRDSDEDKILMVSQSLGKKSKGHDVLVGVFTYGKGSVLHYTSHIHALSLSSEIVKPQEIIAINFILEALGKTAQKM